MKSSIAVAAGMAAAILLVAPASAVDVENDDENAYEITITGDNGEAANFELTPGARESDVCAMRCTVNVEGIGSIDALEDELVVIRDGQLSKQPKRL